MNDSQVEKLKILGESKINIRDLKKVNFGWFDLKNKSTNKRLF